MTDPQFLPPEKDQAVNGSFHYTKDGYGVLEDSGGGSWRFSTARGTEHIFLRLKDFLTSSLLWDLPPPAPPHVINNERLGEWFRKYGQGV